MDCITTDSGFTLLGEPTTGDLYKLLTARTDQVDTARELTVPASKLSGWLMARGCEFCAHQVKLGRFVRCDHPPLTRDDLIELGFAVDGL